MFFESKYANKNDTLVTLTEILFAGYDYLTIVVAVDCLILL